MAAERRVLERCVKGDRIAFTDTSSFCNQPLLERIGKMVDGGAPSLRVLSVREIDGNGKIRNLIKRPLFSKKSKIGPALAERIFVVLECTAAKVRATELLGPVFDLSEMASGAHGIYSRTASPPGLYSVAEVRLKLEMKVHYDATYDMTGTHYLDFTKIFNAIRELSKPVEDGGNRYMREWVMKAAYFFHKKRPLCSDVQNWNYALKGMAASMAWSLDPIKWRDRSARFSGPLRGGDVWNWESCGGGDNVALAHILNRLKTDDGIEIIPSDPARNIVAAEIFSFIEAK